MNAISPPPGQAPHKAASASRRKPLAIGRLAAWTMVLLMGAAASSSRAQTTQATQPVASAPSGRPQPPNIVLIMTDDLRDDVLGCTGHPFIETPHIDRLAREGALFTSSFSVTPKCCPARATILTGAYSDQHGVTTNCVEFIHRSAPMLPSHLRNGGYETAFMGKWHIGETSYQRPGFDHWVAYVGAGDQGTYVDAEFNINGRMTQTQGYSTDVLAGMAARWLRRERTQPFFLMLCLKNPHMPRIPPTRHAHLYADETIILPKSLRDPPESLPAALQASAAWLDKSAREEDNAAPHAATQAATQPGLSIEDVARQRILEYSRMIPSIDDAVGQVLTALEESGQLDRTLVVFTSDNGMLLGEHGMKKKDLAYEPSIRVPLVMRYPPLIRAATRIPHQVLNLDLAPTLLDVGQAHTFHPARGKSFLPLLRGDKYAWRQTSLFVAPYMPGDQPAYLAVRTRRWKYVRFTAIRVEEQLFDLQTDPDERNNLAGLPEHKRQLNVMRQELFRTMSQEVMPKRWLEPFTPKVDPHADCDSE